MSRSSAQIVPRLRAAEAGLAREVHDLHVAQRQLKQGLVAYARESGLFNLMTAPVIYSLIGPLLLLARKRR